MVRKPYSDVVKRVVTNILALFVDDQGYTGCMELHFKDGKLKEVKCPKITKFQ